MKIKISAMRYEGDSEISKEVVCYESSIGEDIEQLLPYGFKIFKIEVLEK